MKQDVISLIIDGAGLRISYFPSKDSVILYLRNQDSIIQMSEPTTLGYPIVDGNAVLDFCHISCSVDMVATLRWR